MSKIIVHVTDEHINRVLEEDRAGDVCGCAIHDALTELLGLDRFDASIKCWFNEIEVGGVTYKTTHEIYGWQRQLADYGEYLTDSYNEDDGEYDGEYEPDCPLEITLCFDRDGDDNAVVYDYEKMGDL